MVNDKFCLEILEIIFPELKYFNVFSRLNSYATKILNEVEFIFLISLLIIDETDNTDYFLYKFNVSKKDKKRIKDLEDFYKKEKITKKLSEKNLNRVFYYKGKDAVIDILNFKIFKSKKLDNDIIELLNLYKNKVKPTMPVKADILIKKYKIPEGKLLGDKLRLIEEEWVNNNFQISDQEIEIIANR